VQFGSPERNRASNSVDDSSHRDGAGLTYRTRIRSTMLPESLVGIDGLSNLLLASMRCNGDKSGALQHERVVAAARGIYRGQPAGVPTRSGVARHGDGACLSRV
jgi:hypothetical protein